MVRLIIISVLMLLTGCTTIDYEQNFGNTSGVDSSHRTWIEPHTGMEFVWVPKGCYQMGSNHGEKNERPVHKVCLDGFWMSKYETTEAQWENIMGNNPCRFKKGANYPVVNVSWLDTKDFISKLNSISEKKFGLPTEAQWEYAARSGGKNEKYSGSNYVDSVAWHKGNYMEEAHPVGTKKPNGLGLYDMSGNKWEWCEDVYEKNAYSKHTLKNPLHIAEYSDRVLRGGCYGNTPYALRTTHRYSYSESLSYGLFGFRLIAHPDNNDLELE